MTEKGRNDEGRVMNDGGNVVKTSRWLSSKERYDAKATIETLMNLRGLLCKGCWSV